MNKLTSFVDCTGTLMPSTGPETLLESAHTGVQSLLNDKAWPKAVMVNKWSHYQFVREMCAVWKVNN